MEVNSLSDSEAGDILANLVGGTTIAPETCHDYTGSYLPETSNLDPELASFEDVVTANVTYALGQGTDSDDDNAVCELCPPDEPAP